MVEESRRHRRMIVAVIIVFAALGGAWELVVGRTYKATVLVALVPMNSGAGTAGASMLGQLGPLAGIMGLGNNGQRPEPIAVLQSRTLTERYIQENDLLPVLFWRRWDEYRHGWRSNAFFKSPTLWKGNEKFADIRRVVQDSKTNLITVTIVWRDPRIAAKWANDLVALTNLRLREREIREAQRNITYLTDRLSKTTLVEVHNALSGLIENEIKREMLAEGADEFAMKVIDPAVPPEEPSSPGFFLSLAFGGLGGLFVAALIVVIRTSLDPAQPPGREAQ
jgi:uncharacterized protein involved in exopolysaccharide biosynthesis